MATNDDTDDSTEPSGEQRTERRTPVTDSVADVEPPGEYLDEFPEWRGTVDVVLPDDVARAVSRSTARSRTAPAPPARSRARAIGWCSTRQPSSGRESVSPSSLRSTSRSPCSTRSAASRS